MAFDESQRREGIEPAGQGTHETHETPEALLGAVMDRLARRDASVRVQSSLQELLRTLRHPQWEVRAAAARSLGDLGERAPLEPLLTASRDEHRLVRAAAARALGRLGSRVPLQRLVIASQDREWEVREMVIVTLGELGTRAPRALFVSALQDGNAAVRDAAALALRQYAATPALYAQTQPVTKLSVLIKRLWQVFSRQILLVHRSVWVVPLLGICAWCFLTAFSSLTSPASLQATAFTLSLFTTISAATGAAFMYGMEQDPGFEITLSTPTSTRAVMLSRLLLVICFNVLLAACASAALALQHGGGLWSIIHVWLGPLVLTASIATTLSLLMGSWFAALAATILEMSQAFAVNLHHAMPVVSMLYSATWQTNPLVLLLAALFVACATVCVSRQPRLTQLEQTH